MPHRQTSQRLHGEYAMTKLTRPTADLKVSGRDLALRGFKTIRNRLAGSGDANHLQANLLRCKGHGVGLVCRQAHRLRRLLV